MVSSTFPQHFPEGYFPNNNFPCGNFPNVQFPKSVLAEAFGPKPILAAVLGPLAHPSRSAPPPLQSAAPQRAKSYLWKLSLGRFHVWEVATWEIVYWEVVLENCLWESS